MTELQRITTEYVATEDRIRLAGEVRGGAPVLRWLTQRLLPTLIKGLDTAGVDTTYSDFVNSFAQQAATARMQPAPPVQADAAGPGWRVLAVDVQQSWEQTRLSFRGDAGQQVSLTLATPLLRQWLAILHGAYRKGDWPLQLWPQWLEQGSPMPDQQAVVLH